MKTVRSQWRATVLVCRKCSKKVGGGFGEDGGKSLAKALRGEMGGGKGRKANVGVVEVDCLKICPKRGVVALNAAAPREWLGIAPGTPVTDVAARLGLDALAENGAPPEK
ncbi:MAG: hypothetical protein ABW173_00210 [Sphingomonas sp.]